MGAWWTGKGRGRQTFARHGAATSALGGPTGDCSSWQRRGGLLQGKLRETQRVYRQRRSGPDGVLGNLFPTWEIYFPFSLGINIPSNQSPLCCALQTDLQVNARLLQTHVQKTTGHMLTTKDIHNATSRASSNDDEWRQTMEHMEGLRKADSDASVDIAAWDNNVLDMLITIMYWTC